MTPPHQPLQYHGGPVLRTFQIFPLFYGKWSSADLTAEQNYLTGLAGYLSGNNKPAGQQPMLWQYGVNGATVARGVTASPSAVPARLSHNDVANIIRANQSSGNLPAFGPATLIMVFLAHGFGLAERNGCGYHHSESPSAFWAVVPQDAGVGTPVEGPVPASPAPFQLVTGHEVFEAAADPAIDHAPGWDEAVDGCPDGLTSYGGSWIDVTFGFIPGVADNAQNGSCSTTGYNSTDDVQLYGSSYADYRNKYDQLFPQGWRLYILQSFVTPNGQVLYNAVWRPGTMPETQLYGSTYADYRKKYDALYPQGWRLYILDAFVMPNGQVLYNAVWRNGDLGETQLYGFTETQFRSQYDQLWPQNWRLRSLQSYVANGQVFYNAVWGPGASDEQQVYGSSSTEYRNKYDALYPQGWRLYILQSYVTSNGQLLYNAVWRPGNMPETQVYAYAYADYRKKYDELYPQGWRLYILDSYVMSTGQVLYNAIWRLGTSNRPL